MGAEAAITLAVLLPIATALGALVVPPRRAGLLYAPAVAATGLVVSAVVATVFFDGVGTVTLGGWRAPLGIALRVDGASAAMLALTAGIFAAASVYARGVPGPFEPAGRLGKPLFWPIWFVLWAGLNGLFLSGDLFNIYVCLEVVTLAAVALVAQAGTSAVLSAALRYLVYALFGSLFYLLGVALIYGEAGVLDLVMLGERAQPNLTGAVAVAMMTVGLLLKTAAFPFHFWLPPAHANAAAPVSAVLSALVVKASFYLLVRLWLGPFFAVAGESAFHLLGGLGAVAMIWGAVQASLQSRLKLIVAYSTVAQIGYLLLIFPLVLLSPVEAWTGGFYQALAHGTAKAAAFLAAGNILLATGTDRLERLAGLHRQLGMSLIAFALAGVSLIGLPPFGGFVAKWLLMEAALIGGAWGWVVLLMAATALTAIYIVRVLSAAMTTPANDDASEFRAIPRTLEFTALGLAIAALALGLIASPVQQLLTVGAPFEVPAAIERLRSTNGWLLVAILLSSAVPGLVIFFLKESQAALRSTLNLAGAGLKVAFVILLLWGVYRGGVYEARLAYLPGIDIVLRADALSMQFVGLSAGLWLVTTVYAIGYLEGSPDRSRFFGFFSLSVTASTGVALSGNLLTLLFFYELLTIATYPLVVHRGVANTLAAGRIYLAYTLGGGLAVLVGAVWLHVLDGSLEFLPGNSLGGLAALHPAAIPAIFGLLIIGFGTKAAIVPLHGWLPRAMVAPAPVSALLHAVAVVKAGAFGIMRVVYDIFGIDFVHGRAMADILLAFAAFTVIYGSIQALRQDDIKHRLAFSTVSQLSYIIVGVALAGPAAMIGALVHLVHQGIMKITLFFCAGNLAEVYGIKKVAEIDGMGRVMPLTMTTFTIAALGMIGLPPLAGFISKWYLATGAVAAGSGWVTLVFVASSVLNAAYFLPLVYAAWFRPLRADRPRMRDAGGWLLLPPFVTATLTLGAGLLAAWQLSPLGWAEVIVQRVYLGAAGGQ